MKLQVREKDKVIDLSTDPLTEGAEVRLKFSKERFIYGWPCNYRESLVFPKEHPDDMEHAIIVDHRMLQRV